MRIVFITFGILSLVAVLIGCVGVGIRDIDILNIAELGSLGDYAIGLSEASPHVPTENSLNTGMALALLIILLSILGIVSLFLKGKGVVMASAGLIASCTTLLWILQPSFESSNQKLIDPKSVALFVMISGIIGAACIYGSYATRKKKPTLA